MKRLFYIVLGLWLFAGNGLAQQKAGDVVAPLKNILADYDNELRLPDGRVDVDSMEARLKELEVNTYFWLVWHAPTDWEDLPLFLPKAAQAGIQVWVYLAPPSESAPHDKLSSEPFRLDYLRWAEEIAKLSLRYPNLTGWVIDDFYENNRVFTPQYVGEMQARAKGIAPRLAFLPLMYYGQIEPQFVEDYGKVIDGVVVAYPQDREDIEQARTVLNGERLSLAEIIYPVRTPSHAGDFASASQTATVLPADRYMLRFRERDSFNGKTTGYHFKQLLVDDAVVWEEDVAGGARRWSNVVVDVTAQAKGKDRVTLAFRLMDKKGVSNFGVRWWVKGFEADGLRLDAGLQEPEKWRVSKRGEFKTDFGEKPRERERLHTPFIVMTAASPSEFRHRHGDPASPERIAEWLQMALQAWRDGKCDGVVTYCLDKRSKSNVFPLAQRLFVSTKEPGER